MANPSNQPQSIAPLPGSKKPSAPAYAAPTSPLGRVPTPPGMASRPGSKPAARRASSRRGTPWLTFSAFVTTMLWFGIVGFYVIKAGGFTSFLESSGAAAIIAVTGLMLAPATLFWMVFAYIKRASDIETALEPLLRQLSLVTGSGGVAETRVRRFNDALTEQLSLLKETGVTSTKTAQKALETLTAERTQLEQSQTGFATQIESLVATMRQHSGELEAIVDSGQGQMNRIAIGAREVSAALTGETHAAETKLSTLIDTITGKFNASFVRLDKEQQEHLQSYASISHQVTQNLRQDSGEIEGKLTSLLNAVTETLEEVERISAERLEAANDASVQIAAREKSLRTEAAVVSADLEDSAMAIVEATERFKELSANGRSEAETLLAALNEQTETLGKHTGDARVRLEATRDLITNAVTQLESTATRINTVGEDVSLSVDSRVAALGDAATALDTTAHKITSQLDLQLTGYGEAQNRVDALYANVLERLRSESAALNHAAEKLSAEADNSANLMRASTDGMAKAAGQQLDGYLQAIDSATTTLDEKATTTAARIRTVVEDMTTAASQQFKGYVQAIETVASTLDEKANTSVARMRGTAEEMATATTRQLDAYSQAIEVAATKLDTQAAATSTRVQDAITELSKTTSQSLDSYGAIAGKADAQATMVADNFNNAIDRYAGTARQLNVAAAELQQLAARCDETIAEMGSTLTERAENLEQVSERMAGTSRGVKEDANVLTVTLQQLADRLETIRAAATETSDQTVLRMTDIASVAGRNLSGIDQLASATIAKLESASGEIARQQGLIGQQVDTIHANLATVSDDLSSRIGGILSDVERSSQNATALIGNFLDSARDIAPALQQTASHATESVLAATATMSTETERFGDRLIGEKTRWQALIDEQGRAFADTLRDLEGQMTALRAVNADLDAGAQRATERLLTHNSAVVDLDTRLVASGRTQGEQLENVRGEIEKIVDYLQCQALALNAVTQTAIEGVRGATETFGSEARGLGDLSRQTEAQIIAATERMGDARTATAATREDIYALRTEIEQTLEKLTAQTHQLEVTRAITNETASELSAQTGQANLQLATLTSGLGDALERATLARASAFVQLDDVAGRVRGETETLEQVMTSLSERANTILAGIGNAGTQAGQQIETQLDATLATLRIQLDTIAEDVTSLATTAAESAGNAAVILRAQVAEQLATVESQTESTLEQIGARAEVSAAQISSATRILTEAGYQSTEQFERALSQISATDATLGQLTEHAATMRKQLIDESESTISALDRITGDLTSQLGLLRSTSETGIESASRETENLRELLDQATVQLTSGALQLKDVSQTAGTYLAGLGSQLETQVALVRDTSAELNALSRDTVEGESQLTERLGNLMGQITRARGDLAALDLQLAQQAAQLSAQQQETLATLGATLVSLEETGSRIVTTGSETLDSIRTVETRYQTIAEQASQIAATHSADLERVATHTAATLGEITQALQTAGSEQNRQLTAQQEQLASLYGALRTESTASGETLAALADRITAAGYATGNSAQQIIERLGTVAQSLIGEFTNVTDAATLATGTLTGETGKLQLETSQIGLAARTAANDTGEAFATLRQQGIEAQAMMTTQLADTLGTLSAAQENYAALNNQLARQSSDADSLLQTVSGKFESLLEAAQRTVTQLRQEMESFTAATSSVLDQSGMDSFGDRLNQLVSELGQGTQQTLGDLRSVTAGLEIARDRTTQVAQEAENKLFEATALLEARHSTFAQTAEAVASRIVDTAAGRLLEATSALEARQQSFAETAELTASRLTESATGQFSAATSLLESHHQAFAETADAMAAHIADSASGRLLEATSALEARQQSFAETAELAASRITNSATEQFSAATSLLESQHQAFAETAELAASRITNSATGQFSAATSLLESQHQTFAETADAMATRIAANTQTTLSAAAATLETQHEAFAETTETLAARIGAANTQITEVSQQVGDVLASVSSTIEDGQKRFGATAAIAAMRVNEAGKHVNDLLSSISGTIAGTADEVFAALNGSFDQNEQQFAARTATTVQTITQAGTEVGELLTSIGSTIASTADNMLHSLDSSFDRSEQKFATRTAATAQTVAEAGTEIGELLSSINDSMAAKAQGILNDVATTLTAQQETLLAAGEQRAETLIAGFDRFKDHLDMQVESLTQQLTGAMDYADKQATVFATLGSSHAALRKETEATLHTLTAAARRVTETGSDVQNDLSDVASRLTGLRGIATTAIQGEITELTQLIDGATSLISDLGHQLETQVSAITDAGSALAHVSGGVNDNTAAALSRLQTLNQRLEAAKLSATMATEQAARRVAEILEQVDSDDDLDTGIERAS